MRSAFKKTPAYHEAKRRAKHEYTVKAKNGNDMRRVHYKCASCGKFFLDKTGAKEIAVDHTIPVVDPAVGYVDIGTYIARLFCDVDNLNVLCNYPGERDGVKSCHKIKTAAERAIQAERQRNEKVK